MNININFANILLEKNIEEKEIKKIKKINNLKDLSRNGWTILSINQKTKEKKIVRPYSEYYLKLDLEKKKIKLILNNMIKNWNDFRDTDIELRGDLSIYFNYKKEIERMILEDKNIEEMFSNDNNSEYSDNDLSDDDSYKFTF